MDAKFLFPLAVLTSTLIAVTAGFCTGTFDNQHDLGAWDDRCNTNIRYCRQRVPGNPFVTRECQRCNQEDHVQAQGFPNLHGNQYCQERYDRTTVPRVRNVPRGDAECHTNDNLGRRDGLCAVPNDQFGIDDQKIQCKGFEYQGTTADRPTNPEMKVLFGKHGQNEIHYHMNKLDIQTAQVKKESGTNYYNSKPIVLWRDVPQGSLTHVLYNACKDEIKRQGNWRYGTDPADFFRKKGNSRTAPESSLTFKRYIFF